MIIRTVCLTIILCSTLTVGSTWARKPVIPDVAAMDKVNQEISRMVQEKEYNISEDLSLYRCYGKIYIEEYKMEDTKQIEAELKKRGITIERLKVNQQTKQSYMIVSIVSHDTQELKNFIAVGFTSVEQNSSFINTLYQGRHLVSKNMGCTEIQLQ